MSILITGGTGFLGSALTKRLIDQGESITLLSREPEKAVKRFGNIKAIKDLQAIENSTAIQVIINLAGAPIFDAYWTAARKELIRTSRIDLTNQLVALIARLDVKPELLISGSAIGFYGDQADTELTEQSMSVPDFSQQLCADWESSALVARDYGVRVCLIRTGLVIDQGGGLLERMLLPFKLALGGRIGEGKQWMSWIHRQDWLDIIQAMIETPAMHGAYNATAPNPVNNLEFTRSLGRFLNRPTCLPLPAWLLKLILGEMSALLLGSQRVIPEKLLQQGFKFQYPTLNEAFTKIFSPSTSNQSD